ncbi:MAG: hypothetical protein HKN88_05740 [Gammaproteobacteria bacterium]|nr:hypothetical protein [Gammaproteobacteria bacterium]
MQPIKQIIQDQFALLTFKEFKPKLSEFGSYYLLFGLFTAWLAGVGRYWDNPKAELWQHLGLGSVAYCFFLSALLYFLLLPLRPKNWTYRTVLIFVSMTSLPAVLYAIPVERFLDIKSAQLANVWFLAVVAIWRVILLLLFLLRSAKLGKVELFIAAFLPIVMIVTVLSALNLEHVVFNIMAGFSPEDVSGNDLAYQILVSITFLSIFLLPFLFIGYIWFVIKAYKKN